MSKCSKCGESTNGCNCKKRKYTNSWNNNWWKSKKYSYTKKSTYTSNSHNNYQNIMKNNSVSENKISRVESNQEEYITFDVITNLHKYNFHSFKNESIALEAQSESQKYTCERFFRVCIPNQNTKINNDMKALTIKKPSSAKKHSAYILYRQIKSRIGIKSVNNSIETYDIKARLLLVKKQETADAKRKSEKKTKKLQETNAFLLEVNKMIEGHELKSKIALDGYSGRAVVIALAK
ncbi:MAG: hypothetical protein COB50_04690, partial [Thiotrichales bacterium]